MICDICKQETETTYDLVLFACGLRYELCRKCYCKALGKKESEQMTEKKQIKGLEKNEY